MPEIQWKKEKQRKYFMLPVYNTFYLPLTHQNLKSPWRYESSDGSAGFNTKAQTVLLLPHTYIKSEKPKY